MTNDEKLMQQVMKDLERSESALHKARAALRERLARDDLNKLAEVDHEIGLWPARQEQEPVMIYHGRCTIDCGEHGHHDMEMLKMIPAGTKLYTAPQPAQQPLTYEQIKAIVQNEGFLSLQHFARAIEAALGITGEKK